MWLINSRFDHIMLDEVMRLKVFFQLVVFSVRWTQVHPIVKTAESEERSRTYWPTPQDGSQGLHTCGNWGEVSHPAERRALSEDHSAAAEEDDPGSQENPR